MKQNMLNCNNPLGRIGYIACLLLAGFIAGCVAAPTLVPIIHPTPTENCFSAPVFTAADMQRRVDCHPDAYKLRISGDTVVLFAYNRPVMDWVGPVFVIHIPSASDAVINYDGTLFMKDYKTPEGRAAIEKVLHDPALMAKILERAREIKQGPDAPFIFR